METVIETLALVIVIMLCLIGLAFGINVIHRNLVVNPRMYGSLDRSDLISASLGLVICLGSILGILVYIHYVI